MRKRLVLLSTFLVIALILLTGPTTSAQTPAPSPTPLASPSPSPAQTPSIPPSPSPSASPSITPSLTPSSSPTPVATATPGGVPTATPTVGDRYFVETGHLVPAVFVRYWEANGALPVFGYPISDARSEKSRTDGKEYLVQYFERNRFEWHPEFGGSQNEVLLGLLGVELTQGRTFPKVDPFPSTPSRVYFEATGHSLGQPFLAYWQQYGSLAIFGYPISEPFIEINQKDGKEYLVQYFERNRFEWHPENKAPYDVLLGLLGYDYLDLLTAINPWGPTPPGAPAVADPIMNPARPAAGGKFLQGPHVGDGMIVQAFYQDRTRIFNLINDLDYGWVKQQVEWKDTENPKGAYYWDEIDRIVNDADAHNLKVLITVVKAPEWATGGAHGFPTNPQDLGDFMQAMAQHFNGRVAAYEIWNEQNLTGESGEINPGRYVELLKAAYLGVKYGDPAAIVLTGALSPTGVNDPFGKRAPGAMGAIPDTLYLEQMYQYNNGEVRRYFDVLATHPYGFNNPPDTNWPDNPNWNPQFPLASDGKPDFYNRHNSFYFRRIEEQRTLMEKYGDAQKQMWVTEYGWCSDVRPDGYGECKYNSLDQQGQYIVGTIQRSKNLYPWMGVMFVWNLNFSTFQEWYTGPSHFSILNPDWTARPAYFILKNRPAALRSH